MLYIAIAVLALGVIYAVSIAPAAERAVVGLVFAVLGGAGFAAAYALTTAGTFQRDYYPIAGALGGVMVGFAWVSRKRKAWDEQRKQR